MTTVTSPRAAILLCAVLLASSGCVPAKITDAPALRGRAVTAGGSAAPGAIVRVWRKTETPGPPLNLELRTAANGDFSYAGKQRWIMWIVLADLVPETVQVQGTHGESNSEVHDVKYRTEVNLFGLGKPRLRDVGELRIGVVGGGPAGER